MRTLDALILEVAPRADTVIIDDDPERSLIDEHLTASRIISISPDFAQSRDALSRGAESVEDNRLDQWLKGEGSAVVIGQMPKSLARLDYVARSVASAGFSEVTLVFGGNNKHLSRSMNEVLGESFENVSASRGKGKFRCLVASGPTPSTYEPKQADGLVAVGGVFSGAREDFGGQLLAQVVVDKRTAPGTVLDLGCGNGSVAKRVLEAYPDARVVATDADADAVNSARATLGERAEVTWDDAGAQLEPDFDTVLLNPPFHEGTSVDATLVQYLLDAAKRLLKPGGQLYLVHNSHLRYRPEIEARFERVTEEARNQKFTVMRGVKEG
ncbi:class I SAM-dependent methyltransferase [Corynebacterium sp. S7]